MLFISLPWVLACDLVALIGGIVMGIRLMAPPTPEMPVRRQQKGEPPKTN